MKKQLIKCILIAMTFGMLASMDTIAADENTEPQEVSGSTIIIDRNDNVAIKTENAAQEGISAVRLSLDVTPTNETDNIDKVEFEFLESNDSKIADYRYNEVTGQMNIYMADSKPLFSKSNSLKLGTVKALNADGEEVAVDINAPQNALSISSTSGVTTENPAYENENTLIGDDYMDVTMTCPTSYQITIPDSNNKVEAGDKLKVSADDVLIEYDQALKVSVTSANEWKLKDKNNPENPEEVAYQVGVGDEQSNIDKKTENILTVDQGRSAGSVELTIKEVGTPNTAGTFEDTLTFGISIE